MKDKDSDIVSSKSSGINVTYAISEAGDMEVINNFLDFSDLNSTDRYSSARTIHHEVE